MREEVTFTGNIGPGTHVDEKAVESLRRLGAKVQATNILLRWRLSKAGYDTTLSRRATV